MILIPFNLLVTFYRKGAAAEIENLLAEYIRLSPKTINNISRGKKPSAKTLEKFFSSHIGKLILTSRNFVNIFSIRKCLRYSDWYAFIEGLTLVYEYTELPPNQFLALKSFKLVQNIALLDYKVERYAGDYQRLRAILVESKLPFISSDQMDGLDAGCSRVDLGKCFLTSNIDSMLYIFASFNAEMLAYVDNSEEVDSRSEIDFDNITGKITVLFSGNQRQHWLRNLKNRIGVGSTNELSVLYADENGCDPEDAKRQLRRFQSVKHKVTKKSLDKIIQLLVDEERDFYVLFFYLAETISLLQVMVQESVKLQLMPEECSYLERRFEEYFIIHYKQYCSQKSAEA